MIVVTIAQLREKLPQILGAGASVLLVGPPGVGKTFNAGQLARICGPAVMVNGGSEVDWKMLFPYRMPNGKLMLGAAMAAAGWQLDASGEPALQEPTKGFLIIDEVNRVLPEMKSQFQLLGSDRAIEVPGATPPRRLELDITCVATANPFGLGVEEMSNAELDRYDVFLCLQPTAEEVAQIIAETLATPDHKRVQSLFAQAQQAPSITAQAAQIIYDCVLTLAAKLDDSKFHKPEGIRLAKAIGRILPLGIFTPALVFRSAVERCFPLGRRGAERFRTEFDGIINDVAGTFASKIGSLGGIYKTSAVQRASAAPATTQIGFCPAASLSELREYLEQTTETTVMTRAMPLPRPAMQLLPQLTAAFGAGLAMEVLGKRNKQQSVSRGNVTITMVPDSVRSPVNQDTISFLAEDRQKVLRFCSLVEPRG